MSKGVAKIGALCVAVVVVGLALAKIQDLFDWGLSGPHHETASVQNQPTRLLKWELAQDLTFAKLTAKVDSKTYRETGTCRDTRHWTGKIDANFNLAAGAVKQEFDLATGHLVIKVDPTQVVAQSGSHPSVYPNPRTGVFFQLVNGAKMSGGDGICSGVAHAFGIKGRSPALDTMSRQWAELQAISTPCLNAALSRHSLDEAIVQAVKAWDMTNAAAPTIKTAEVEWVHAFNAAVGTKALNRFRRENNDRHHSWKFQDPRTLDCHMAESF